MFEIKASGTATIDNVEFSDQEVRITGDHDSIKQVEYGDYTLQIVIERVSELIRNPIDYYAVPERPEPNTLKAAVVAIDSIWQVTDIETQGEINTDEPYIEGAIY